MLTHADAAAAAAQVPDMANAAPGSQGLPLPRTIVEAMSMMAYARQNVRWQNSTFGVASILTHLPCLRRGSWPSGRPVRIPKAETL